MADYEITTDRSRMCLDEIHAYLASSYWSPGVPVEVVRRAIEHSVCVGAFAAGRQVGFGRAVTDCATFAYLADVYVLEAHRGRGLALRMMRTLLGLPELQGLRRLMLVTRDAHRLYQPLGFRPLADAGRVMEIHHPDVYAVAGPEHG